MPQGDEQRAVVTELYNRIDTLDPERAAIVRELHSRMGGGQAAHGTPQPQQTAEQGPGGLQRFASGLWKQVNPVAMVQGIAGAVASPIETLKAQGAAHLNLLSEGDAAMKAGDYVTGVRKALEFFMPLGPAISEMGDRAASGDIAGAAGEATGMAGLTALGAGAPGAAGKAAGAARGVARAAGQAAKSGVVRDVVGVVSPRAGRALDLVENVRGALRKAEPPVEAPAPVVEPPVAAPTPKKAPPPRRRVKKEKPAEDAGPSVAAETEAEKAARVAAQNRSFWKAPENPRASRTFAPSEAKPAAKQVAAALRDELEASGTPTNPPLKPARFGKETRVDAARADKSRAIAQALKDAGVTSERVKDLTGVQWAGIAKEIGQRAPSPKTVERILFELAKLEKAK